MLASSIGIAVTASVELAFARMKPGDDIVLPIAERLAAVQSLLTGYVEDRPVDREAEKIARLAMLGTSTLRSALRRSDYSPEYTAQMSGVVALVGRLMDIAATLTQLSFEFSATGQKQLRNLAATVARIRTDLLNRQIPGSIHFNSNDEPLRGVTLLREMEKIVALIPQAFAGSQSMDEYLPPSADSSRLKLFAADALTNPEHLQFAMKGCLAAEPLLHGLRLHRLAGYQHGGNDVPADGAVHDRRVSPETDFAFRRSLGGGLSYRDGLADIHSSLPRLDCGIHCSFHTRNGPGFRFVTCSPRLSYFGLQVALAFYLINLQKFAVEISLSIARDRIVGILLGLFMMWLVFDQLDGMADRMEGKSSEGSDNFKRSVKSLDQTIRTYYSGKSSEVAAQFGVFLSLSRRIESLTLSLDEEMQRKM
jgi:multidrug resistance protein MdtO